MFRIFQAVFSVKLFGPKFQFPRRIILPEHLIMNVVFARYFIPGTQLSPK